MVSKIEKVEDDYFDELLDRIKEIRASERRFYQKIKEIYVGFSYDYDKDSEITKHFFAIVQNKLHLAISGKTAVELIMERADSSKKNMGLTTWKNSPEGNIIKDDVKVGKNYLDKEEISELNNIVGMFLDYAENQTRRHKLIFMAEWIEKLDEFLKFNEYKIVNNSRKISRVSAEEYAFNEYRKYKNLI